jgi:hypothetical protein
MPELHLEVNVIEKGRVVAQDVGTPSPIEIYEASVFSE